MKKNFINLIILLIFSLIVGTNMSLASYKVNSELASLINMYKQGNYTGCYLAMPEYIKKDSSNPLAYYYYAIVSVKMGKKDEAEANYTKVITLSGDGVLKDYANKGLACIREEEGCTNDDEKNQIDNFIKTKSAIWTKEVQGDYEQQRLNNLRMEINKDVDFAPAKLKKFKDFSSELPTDDEIISALNVLQKAGISINDITNIGSKGLASDLFDNGNINAWQLQSLMLGNIPVEF